MNRRSYLGRLATAATVTSAGCVGGGGEVVISMTKDVRVSPNSGWKAEIPDVSDPGGSISYIARARQPFDVYFFVGRDQYERYNAFVNGREVGQFPAGDQEIGRTATEIDGGMYEATSKDGGARMAIDEPGPYYFVLDNSDYPAAGGAYLRDPPKPRQIQLDLTVTKQRFGI